MLYIDRFLQCCALTYSSALFIVFHVLSDSFLGEHINFPVMKAWDATLMIIAPTLMQGVKPTVAAANKDTNHIRVNVKVGLLLWKPRMATSISTFALGFQI